MNLQTISLLYSYAKGANVAAMTLVVWSAATAGVCLLPWLKAYRPPPALRAG